MKVYTLYLDESETYTQKDDRFFSVGGIIIENSQKDSIDAALSTLKINIWNNSNATQFILHEKEISAAQKGSPLSSSYNQIFRSHANVNELYKGLSSIINKFELTTLGTCINMNGLNYYYSGGTNDKLTIALHMLLENYCHFLISHDAQGSVCYESLNEPGNQGLRQRFYELKALGSLYYTSSCFQKHILEISFLEKSKNITGLQLADFIPNTQARQAAGLKPKHNDFKKNVIRHAYDGKLDMKNKFGLKTIP